MQRHIEAVLAEQVRVAHQNLVPKPTHGFVKLGRRFRASYANDSRVNGQSRRYHRPSLLNYI
jgi:hypothetical protein